MKLPAARIAGQYTREQLGMRAPVRRSKNISPEEGGCTLHWGGKGSRITRHSECETIWRSWQIYHMDTNGWSDIAYTAGFCQHGYVFPGRGYGVRTAGQGCNDGNQRSYAFVHINADNEPPSEAALSAATWLVSHAQTHGNAGKRVWGHKEWVSTDCPGPDLQKLAVLLNATKNLPVPRKGTTVTTPVDDDHDDEPTLQEIQAGVLFYRLKDPYVNPLTILTRTYDEVNRISVRLKSLETAFHDREMSSGGALGVADADFL